MDASAIIMMVLFLLVIWGGLVASIVHYVGHPDEADVTPRVNRDL